MPAGQACPSHSECLAKSDAGRMVLRLSLEAVEAMTLLVILEAAMILLVIVGEISKEVKEYK